MYFQTNGLEDTYIYNYPVIITLHKFEPYRAQVMQRNAIYMISS